MLPPLTNIWRGSVFLKQKWQDKRGLALLYITDYAEKRLRFSRNDFLAWLEDAEKGKSEKTLMRYINGESAMGKWTFKEFWALVEDTIESYLEYHNSVKLHHSDATKIWNEEKVEVKDKCRIFFYDIFAAGKIGQSSHIDRLEKFGDSEKHATLEALRPIYLALDCDTAYRLQKNFPALASVTVEDIKFMGMLREQTSEDSARLKSTMLQSETVDAMEMLKNLQSIEARCWVDIKNADYSDISRKRDVKSSWRKFYDQSAEIKATQFMTMMSFLLVCLFSSGVVVDEKSKDSLTLSLPSADDIELLLLFKYCISRKARATLLDKV